MERLETLETNQDRLLHEVILQLQELNKKLEHRGDDDHNKRRSTDAYGVISRNQQEFGSPISMFKRPGFSTVKSSFSASLVFTPQGLQHSLTSSWDPVVEENRGGVAIKKIEDPKYRYRWNSDLFAFEKEPPTLPLKPSGEEKNLWTSHLGNCWKVPEDHSELNFRFQAKYLAILNSDKKAKDFELLEKRPSENWKNLKHKERFIHIERGLDITDFCCRDGNVPENYTTKKYSINKGVKLPDSSAGDEMILENLQPPYAEFRGVWRPWESPWRRIIGIWGAPSAVSEKCKDVWEVFPWFKPYYNDGSLLPVVLKAHLDRSPLPPLLYSDPSRYSLCPTLLAFHVTFYEIFGPSDSEDVQNKAWKAGPLYGDSFDLWGLKDALKGYTHAEINKLQRTHKRYLRESAITIIVFSQDHRTPPPFWTTLILGPETNANFSNQINHKGFVDNINSVETMLRLVEESVAGICLRLEEFRKLFDHLLGGKEAWLNPDQHDRLLSDDETFSRSKAYFWTINFLKEMDRSIAANIEEVEKFRDNCTFPWRRFINDRNYGPSEIEDEESLEVLDHFVRKKLRHSVEKLKVFKQDFRSAREEAIALRDGLFSASAVMESRASTRLGENVKLLTFVSIFFLPLSFCMSVWSINDDLFGLSTLAIVTTVLALSTYIIIFNIKNLSNGIQSAYFNFASILVKEMKNDGNKEWRDRAAILAKIESRSRSSNIPSNWRLLQFVITRPSFLFRAFPKLFLPGKRERPLDGAESKDVFSASETNV